MFFFNGFFISPFFYFLKIKTNIRLKKGKIMINLEFVQLPVSALMNIKDTSIKVFGIIYTNCKLNDNTFYHSYGQFADELHTNISYVKRALKDLKSSGYIEIKSGKGTKTPNTFHLTNMVKSEPIQETNRAKSEPIQETNRAKSEPIQETNMVKSEPIQETNRAKSEPINRVKSDPQKEYIKDNIIRKEVKEKNNPMNNGKHSNMGTSDNRILNTEVLNNNSNELNNTQSVIVNPKHTGKQSDNGNIQNSGKHSNMGTSDNRILNTEVLNNNSILDTEIQQSAIQTTDDTTIQHNNIQSATAKRKVIFQAGDTEYVVEDNVINNDIFSSMPQGKPSRTKHNIQSMNTESATANSSNGTETHISAHNAITADNNTTNTQTDAENGKFEGYADIDELETIFNNGITITETPISDVKTTATAQLTANNTKAAKNVHKAQNNAHADIDEMEKIHNGEYFNHATTAISIPNHITNAMVENIITTAANFQYKGTLLCEAAARETTVIAAIIKINSFVQTYKEKVIGMYVCSAYWNAYELLNDETATLTDKQRKYGNDLLEALKTNIIICGGKEKLAIFK